MRRSLIALVFALSLPAADFDILIRNARVIDGTGNPWFRADVGVRDGRIAALGRLSGATAYREINAGGRVVAPGFIDVHTHVEGGIEKVPRADNYIADGVTTIVTGNCGGSKLNLAEWFPELERKGLGLNVASLIGHNTVRREVMGTANRQASPDEIGMMRRLVDKAMQDGAVGFSTGLIYIPGTYANTAEVVQLAKAAAQHGGVYASHMRDEGEKVLEAIEEAVTVGREAGMPVQLSHFKIDNRKLWGSAGKSIALVEKFRREGVDVVVDQYPYERSSTNLGITLPSWALADGDEKVKERLNDPVARRKILSEMLEKARRLGHDDYSYATVASFPPDRSYDGKTISEINALRQRPKTIEAEAETILDLLGKGGAQMIYHSMGEADVANILRYPNTGIASDGGVREFGVGMPHPRSYGTNARVLAEYVRKRGVITLEDAIRRMTALPARTFRFRDRGLVQEGLAADLVVFDPDRVQDKATFEAPHQLSEGFDFVLVNGKIAVEDGKPTGVLAGRVVRRR
jgi:N-acyl-D-amino-acid deacylase